MPQLDAASSLFISQLFWLAVSFALLYLLLSRVLLPPLTGIMQQRKDTVSGDILRAQTLKEEAEQAREQYERTVADAHLRSQQVFADAGLAIKQHAEKANTEMDRVVAEKLAQAQAAIAAKKQEVYTQLASDSAELVAGIVEKFTNTRPDAARISALLRSLSSS